MLLNRKKIVAITILLLLSFCTTVPLLGSYERDYGPDKDYKLPKETPPKAKKPQIRTSRSGNCCYCGKYRVDRPQHEDYYCPQNPDRRERNLGGYCPHCGDYLKYLYLHTPRCRQKHGRRKLKKTRRRPRKRPRQIIQSSDVD